MRPFRKTNQDLFICEECKRIFKKPQTLSKHISLEHDGVKTYTEKWRKEEGDGICETCGKETDLNRTEYRRFCSVKCSSNNKNLSLIKKEKLLLKKGLIIF